MAISEQPRHRKDLAGTVGLLQGTCHYVVSRSKAREDALEGAVEGAPQPGDACDAAETLARNHSMASAFQLLANLSYPEEARRRTMDFDGVVSSAAAAVSSAVVAIGATPVVGAGPGAWASRHAAVRAGEMAAALLHRLVPVLGAEGDEEQLVAAGEALSAAVCAVSAARGGGVPGAGVGVPVGAERDGPGAGGGRGAVGRGSGQGDGAVRRSSSQPGVDRGLDGLALEALSALLVLSWSDGASLEAAAAVDGIVTDARLAASLVSICRRGSSGKSPPRGGSSPGRRSGPDGHVQCSPAFASAAVAFLSSIAHRPAGRSALVTSGAATVLVDLLSARAGAVGLGRELSSGDRGELLRLLCILCSSPAHRSVVREALVAAGGGGTDGGRGGDPSVGGGAESVVEAQLVVLQGQESSPSWECRAGVGRLAGLLGVSPPSAPRRRSDPGPNKAEPERSRSASAAQRAGRDQGRPRGSPPDGGGSSTPPVSNRRFGREVGASANGGEAIPVARARPASNGASVLPAYASIAVSLRGRRMVCGGGAFVSSGDRG